VAKKLKAEVVAQFLWTAVVRVPLPQPDFQIEGASPARFAYAPEEEFSYDIKEWDLYRLRWGNMSQAKGFGDLALVSKIAKERSDQIEAMIQANRQHPPVLVSK
jgi:hypothetical protein